MLKHSLMIDLKHAEKIFNDKYQQYNFGRKSEQMNRLLLTIYEQVKPNNSTLLLSIGAVEWYTPLYKRYDGNS